MTDFTLHQGILPPLAITQAPSSRPVLRTHRKANRPGEHLYKSKTFVDDIQPYTSQLMRLSKDYYRIARIAIDIKNKVELIGSFPLWTLKQLMFTKTLGLRPPRNPELNHTRLALTSSTPEPPPVRQKERKNLPIDIKSKEQLNSAKRTPLADITTIIINHFNQ